MNHVSKSGQTKPPEKGAFPLDRNHECDEPKANFLNCLKQNKSDHSACRQFSKDYLACRQDKELMDKTPLNKLGFTPEDDKKAKNASQNDFNGLKNKEEFVSGNHIQRVSKPATSWFK
mmetsp:Transcript_15857/g.18710  ORF Transcript_15857/g.18710 Transcript_15857/m.18710 type:complete len:118 (-) Transcript_15857:52-405(-)|eukprot:CAMPEP_0114329788 /NCGR_PEP_ID=MMETSP0101-20121206/1301_1 /TAXON_ID=38822 ORGANISM="Pteridomonas danica, Strain PT" /NCGR_SAMPLE_ID=MMETSP0101 /ASSEMBLY_ACC=CAM_ASM_000211 /LENGTH=117 /DNA_ID=CAMNT_0001459549 /DNA_START=36 /DNA_END=389 /DNA_ORIENTATION=+